MNKPPVEILTELQTIFRDVLDNDEIVLAPETGADDVEEWDSLTHIQLVLAIGKHFGLQFTTEEVISWTNVGSIVSTIKGRLG
jgi:Acyl carrier protein